MKKHLLLFAAALVAIVAIAPPAAPDLAAQDRALAARAPVICKAGEYPYYSPTNLKWYCSTTEPVIFNASALSATATELNKLAGVTGGTTAASKALVVDANKRLDALVLGTLSLGAAGGTAVTATAAELNKLAGVTGGTTTASKALVVDANKALDVLALPVSGLKIGAGAGTAVDATAAQLNTLASVTAGTAAASKAVVLDANKSIDVAQVTTSRTLGGTGVPGAALTNYEFTKEVTAIADATATTILTITVPNAAQAANFEIDVIGRLGAGGAIGADEAVSSSKYQGTCVRTAGVASVCTLSSQLGAVNVAVAGAATVTATLSQTASAEGVSVTNTHLIKITITRSGGSSANHKADVHVRLLNANASGITIQ